MAKRQAEEEALGLTVTVRVAVLEPEAVVTCRDTV
jgi:hypothetical protein